MYQGPIFDTQKQFHPIRHTLERIGKYAQIYPYSSRFVAVNDFRQSQVYPYSNQPAVLIIYGWLFLISNQS